MSFIILPSHRIVHLIKSQNSLKVLSIHAQAYAVSRNGQTKQTISTIFNKTMTLFQGHNLDQIVLERIFSKRLNCLAYSTTNKQSESLIVSDKFGDIHQIDLSGNNKNNIFLNSNLGIPSFIHCYDRSLILGDQMNKIKIYNLENMHQIVSIWYVPFWQPMQIVEVGEKQNTKFVMLGKLRNKEQLEETEQIYLINHPKQLFSENFPGIKIYEGKTTSYAKQSLIKYSSIVRGSDSNLFYITLQKNLITVRKFNFYKDKQSEQIMVTKELKLEQDQSDYLFAVYDEDTKCLLISYGKQLEYEEQIQTKLIKLNKTVEQRICLNKYEHIIKLILE